MNQNSNHQLTGLEVVIYVLIGIWLYFNFGLVAAIIGVLLGIGIIVWGLSTGTGRKITKWVALIVALLVFVSGIGTLNTNDDKYANDVARCNNNTYTTSFYTITDCKISASNGKQNRENTAIWELIIGGAVAWMAGASIYQSSESHKAKQLKGSKSSQQK